MSLNQLFLNEKKQWLNPVVGSLTVEELTYKEDDKQIDDVLQLDNNLVAQWVAADNTLLGIGFSVLLKNTTFGSSYVFPTFIDYFGPPSPIFGYDPDLTYIRINSSGIFLAIVSFLYEDFNANVQVVFKVSGVIESYSTVVTPVLPNTVIKKGGGVVYGIFTITAGNNIEVGFREGAGKSINLVQSGSFFTLVKLS